jgi:hypothetical protein
MGCHRASALTSRLLHATRLALSSPLPPFPPSRHSSWQFELDLSGMGAGAMKLRASGANAGALSGQTLPPKRDGGSCMRRGKERGVHALALSYVFFYVVAQYTSCCFSVVNEGGQERSINKIRCIIV